MYMLLYTHVEPRQDCAEDTTLAVHDNTYTHAWRAYKLNSLSHRHMSSHLIVKNEVRGVKCVHMVS
jgi:hypothetical protein